MKHLCHIILLSCIAGISIQATAQIKLSRQVIGSTGNYSKAGGISISSTTGEPAATTIRGTGIILTQGFQQPSDATIKDFVVLYNGITPNDDGMNDTWIIYGIGEYADNKVIIFNRWGGPVWEADGYDNYDVVWNGTNLQGEDLPDGTYYYIIDIPELDTYKGWVQLTR